MAEVKTFFIPPSYRGKSNRIIIPGNLPRAVSLAIPANAAYLVVTGRSKIDYFDENYFRQGKNFRQSKTASHIRNDSILEQLEVLDISSLIEELERRIRDRKIKDDEKELAESDDIIFPQVY